jgi:aromatase
MAELRIRTARKTVRVAAPPRQVYQLIADTARWPQLFEPTVHVEHLGGSGTTERVRLWELIDNDVRCGESQRELNPRRLQVRFRREETQHPVASMGGLWLVVPKGSGSLVALDHYYRVVDDDPADTRWLAEVVDRTGEAMLSALRENAERVEPLEALLMSCTDSVDIGGDPRDVYDFLARAQDWPQRLPHVDRVLMNEDVPDIQHLESDVRLPNGSVHTTSMVRVCVPQTRIVYKYVKPPWIMRAHTGSFTIATLPHGVRATAEHTVLLRQESTKDTVRQVLRELSLAALGRAKEFAEARRPATARAANQR